MNRRFEAGPRWDLAICLRGGWVGAYRFEYLAAPSREVCNNLFFEEHLVSAAEKHLGRAICVGFGCNDQDTRAGLLGDFEDFGAVAIGQVQFADDQIERALIFFLRLFNVLGGFGACKR